MLSGVAILVATATLCSGHAYAASWQNQQESVSKPVNAVASPDPLFKEPYIDLDEWRSKPVRHRYVHGGFKGTEARFSFYFPPKAFIKDDSSSTSHQSQAVKT